MKNGDFVEIDFVGRVVGTNEIFDLTSAEEAKKEGVFNPKQKYGPGLVVIGAHMTIPGVEKQLKDMEIGEEKEFNVKPDEAFGRRNPKLIKIVPLAQFTRNKINPVPGIFLEIDGRQAKIQSVSGGRVRVDFNHPLAGKELNYKLRIVKKLTNTLEKANALVDYYNIEAKTELKEGVLSIKTEKKLDKPEHRPVKDLLKKVIIKWIPVIKDVKFV